MPAKTGHKESIVPNSWRGILEGEMGSWSIINSIIYYSEIEGNPSNNIGCRISKRCIFPSVEYNKIITRASLALIFYRPFNKL